MKKINEKVFEEYKNTIADNSKNPHQLIKMNVNGKEDELPLRKVSKFCFKLLERIQTGNHLVHK